MAELMHERVGAQVGPYRRRGRRYHCYARAIGGGLFANVIDDRLVSFGIEPVADVVVGVDGSLEFIDRRPVPRLVWAAPLGAAAATAGAVAAGLVLRRRQAA